MVFVSSTIIITKNLENKKNYLEMNECVISRIKNDAEINYRIIIEHTYCADKQYVDDFECKYPLLEFKSLRRRLRI